MAAPLWSDLPVYFELDRLRQLDFADRYHHRRPETRQAQYRLKALLHWRGIQSDFGGHPLIFHSRAQEMFGYFHISVPAQIEIQRPTLPIDRPR